MQSLACLLTHLGYFSRQYYQVLHSRLPLNAFVSYPVQPILKTLRCLSVQQMVEDMMMDLGTEDSEAVSAAVTGKLLPALQV